MDATNSMDDIRQQMPFFHKPGADDVIKYLRLKIELIDDYEPSGFGSLFARQDKMPKIEVTRKGNKYMLIMTNKLLVQGSSLGQDLLTTEARFISFLEVRYIEKRGWLFELKISATAFLDDFVCRGTEELCEFLEKKLPTKVPKLVFPYDLEHY